MRDGDSSTKDSRQAVLSGSRSSITPWTKRAIAVAFGSILVFASFAGALVGRLDRRECTLERVRREGVIRVGYALEAPYAFRRGDHVTGESPELARVVLEAIGLRRIEWVQVEFRSLIPSLLAGHFDMIAAGLFDTPSRRSKIAFSRPTFFAHTALLVNRNDAPRYHGLTPFRNLDSAPLAVLAGAYEGQVARAFGVPEGRLLEVPDLVTGVEAVRSNHAGALALSRISLNTFITHSGDDSLTVVSPLSDCHEFEADAPSGGFGFRIEDRQLRLAIDQELTTFLGTAAHLALVRPFGFEADDLPKVQGPATSPTPTAEAMR